MTAAIALAVVLVIAVAGASMALESQHTATTGAPRPARPRPASPGQSRRPRVRDRMGRANPTPTADVPSPPPAPAGESEVKGPELLRTGAPADAKVISVVDERTIGPVTRSRLTLKVEPKDGSAFEVTLRVAFQTPQARARVKVGGTVPVRYDRDDHTRVVVDLPQD
ncbi:MAG TPA: hypothetical protein VFN68_12200 [Acidimicrobiales bacterium]|nr:hypothetical protein [Acidimicrobiales bacterium]